MTSDNTIPSADNVPILDLDLVGFLLKCPISDPLKGYASKVTKVLRKGVYHPTCFIVGAPFSGLEFTGLKNDSEVRHPY